MRKQNVLNIVSKLLDLASDEFSNHGCNDLPKSFYDGMSKEEIQELYHEFHKWDGDPEKYNPERLNYLGDSILMTFFSEYIKTI